MERTDVVIVGAGHAGAQAAAALRHAEFMGSIMLIGDEPNLPYDRPPLSKDYLSGTKTFADIMLRPPDFWEKRNIRLALSQRVIEVDAHDRHVTLDGGGKIHFESLIWATGGRPRKLTCTGHDLSRVHTVRTRADIDRLKQELGSTARVVIVGGGYIGLEAASVLTKLGKHVTVLEALDRVLARVAGRDLSVFYEAEHRAHGVDIRTQVSVECIVGEDGNAVGVRLSNGDFVPADMVIVGIGVIPAVEPLIAAGAHGGNGVEVDAYCRTNLPGIYAIGDCAAHANRYAGDRIIRIESVQNANDQATTAAKAIVGRPSPYDAVPWFWSHQYDLRLQTIGLSIGHDAALLRGSPVARSFSVVYLKSGRVIALDCVNSTKDYVQGRKLVIDGVIPDIQRLADPGIAIKDLAS